MLPEIKVPTDINLLSIGKENLERMIDLLYDAKLNKKKPRDYRCIARQAYLNNRKGCTTTIRIVSPTGWLFVEQIKRGDAISWIINLNPEGSNVYRINLKVKNTTPMGSYLFSQYFSYKYINPSDCYLLNKLKEVV